MHFMDESKAVELVKTVKWELGKKGVGIRANIKGLDPDVSLAVLQLIDPLQKSFTLDYGETKPGQTLLTVAGKAALTRLQEFGIQFEKKGVSDFDAPRGGEAAQL
ncbi:hypothetical protein BH10PLA2_BH10PLA2_35250 [soil metagenome]